MNAADFPAPGPHSPVAEAQINAVEPEHATVDAEASEPDVAAATSLEDHVAPQTCGIAASGEREEIEGTEGTPSRDVGASGVHEKSGEPAVCASIKEAGTVGEGEEEEEEFEYVIAEFGGPGFLTSSAANEDMALTVQSLFKQIGIHQESVSPFCLFVSVIITLC